MITLRNITLRRGTKVLLEDINWIIYHKQHIGIIGENGSGKSSLFAALLGEIQIDSGELEIPKQLKFSHVAQEMSEYPNSAIDYVLDGDIELRGLQQELLIAEKKDDGSQIAVLHGRLGEIDAYTATARAAQLLNGLGFNHQEQQKSVNAFSGGWRVRLNLAKALMCRSDILLLDEPTNHLDLDAVFWLEHWLVKYSGTLLLISHDREFLDRVADHIAYINHQQLKLYTGNYSSFEKQHAMAQHLQQSSYEKQQKQIAHMQAFVSRFRAKASKARQAQSRLKALERMDLLSAAVIDSPLQFSFKEPNKCPNPLIRLEDASIAYGEKKVLSQLNLSIVPSDRIALLGPNGAGKSSLIKLLAGELNATQGTRETGPGLTIGYFAQYQIDRLQLDQTPLAHLQKIAPNEREQELRKFLGSFGFSKNRVLETVGNFSGGEKSRLALALLVWQRPNLLLLDEPTNHLDIGMRQALSMALQEYAGALILVSHDRFLVRTTVDQLLLVASGKLQPFEGDLNDYERWLFEFRRQLDRLNEPQLEKAAATPQPQHSKQQRSLLQTLKKTEEKMLNLEKELVAVEIKLADTALYEAQNKDVLQEHLNKQADIKQRLQAVESTWLQIQEDLG